ncbi:MAG: NAD(P)H-dependent glycerol-3-phosphate dehydrogenase [Proteobacteria bacterium]|nr:NAD(P)H-dependent glycerol-3-phosphate dehydrogenase [Pseudomonadota bacterium]
MRDNGMKIAVIGGGSWGTTLANLLACKGFDVTLWVFEEEVCRQISDGRENSTYLPGIRLSGNLKATNRLEDAIGGKGLVLWVTPSHIARKMLKEALPLISSDALMVSATKGIEEESLKLNSEIINELLPPEISEKAVYLSGPSFAREVAEKQPTAVTAASQSTEAASKVQDIFSTPYFRVYSATDIVGLEIGGSIKNVIALGAGISDGLGFGSNARAALITRGLAEMSRLGVKMGAQPLTFSGLSGLGDLVLTCTGDLSRNRTVGLRLGRGEKIEDILADMKMVAEGVKTAKAAYNLSQKLGIEMPITTKIYRILYEGMAPRTAVAALMERELKEEIELP